MRYFRELFRLQGELVKLQDWVVATGHKMVIEYYSRRPVPEEMYVPKRY